MRWVRWLGRYGYGPFTDWHAERADGRTLCGHRFYEHQAERRDSRLRRGLCGRCRLVLSRDERAGAPRRGARDGAAPDGPALGDPGMGVGP